MATFAETTIFWNADGYIEVVFVGVQKPEQLSKLNEEAMALLAEHGSASLLIDARYGRMGRDAPSFSILRHLSRFSGIQKICILVDKEPKSPEAGRKSGIIITLMATALGLRPVYFYNEAQARRAVMKIE